MRIHNIHLKNFRGFADTLIEFGDYTILRGDNGAGKSSVLMAIAWAATGLCRETYANGTRWERLRSWGQNQMGVKIKSDLATFARQRAKNGHRLQVEGVEAEKVDAVQALLYDRLQANEHVLLALFDPIPILDREPGTQKIMISRILKPGGIEITDLMRKHGVESLVSLEQVDKRIKDFKDITLRELNRQLKNLQEHPHEKPKWPREGKTAQQLRDGHAQAQRQRDECRSEGAALKERLRALNERKAAAEAGVKLAKGEAGKLEATIKQLTAAIEENDAKWITANDAVEKTSLKRKQISELKQRNVADQLEAKNSMTAVPVECPKGDCPVLATFKESPDAKKNTELEAQITRLKKGYNKLDKDYQKAIEAEEKAKAELKALTEALATDKPALREAEQRLEAHKAAVELGNIDADIGATEESLATARQNYTTAEMVLTKANKAIEEIAAYERAEEAMSAYTTDLAATTAAVREIKELIGQLEKERKRIVDSKIATVLRIMNAFLEPFGLGPVEFDLETGFSTPESEVDRWSDGQRRQILEAAFRVAAAKSTGVDVAVIEHAAPLSKSVERQLGIALLGAGCQVIQVYTTDQQVHPKPGAKFRAWWLSRNGDGEARAVELEPKAVDAGA